MLDGDTNHINLNKNQFNLIIKLDDWLLNELNELHDIYEHHRNHAHNAFGSQLLWMGLALNSNLFIFWIKK